MEETLRMMKQYVIGYEKNKKLEELLSEYKENLNPNILAYLYVSNYGAIYNLSLNYNMLNGDDKASLCLCELDKCIQNYNSTKECSFLTYFLVCYKNRLRAENEQLFSHSKYANYVTNDIDTCEQLLIYNDFEDVFDLKAYKLNMKELNHCNLILDGYSNKELSNILKISVQQVYNINKKIGKKLANIV